MLRTFCLLSAVLVVSQVPFASAQTMPPACDGEMTMVRVDTIKTGKLTDFMAAVQAHQQWYKSHGYKDVIYASKVVTRDEKTKESKFSDSTVMTFHIQLPNSAPPKPDAAWDAYVKQYNDSSVVKESFVTCSPRVTLK